MEAWEQRQILSFDQFLDRERQGLERYLKELVRNFEENLKAILERRAESTCDYACDEMEICQVEEDSGVLEDAIEQSAYQVEFEEDIAGLDKVAVTVEEGMKQITYQAAIKEEYAGLTSNDVSLWVTGELMPTEQGHADSTGVMEMSLGSLKCDAHGGMLRKKMVDKNLIAFGKLVVKSFLRGFGRSIGGNITDISEDVSTKRRRFGAGTGTIT